MKLRFNARIASSAIVLGALITIATPARADDPPPPPLPPSGDPASPPPAPPPPPPPVRPPPPPSVPRSVAPPSAPRDEVDPRLESGFVELHIDADVPDVHLQALTEEGNFMALRGRYRTHVVYGRAYRWERVCVAPCTMRVPPSLVYRVAGPHIPSSDGFAVGPPNGATTLHVKGGSVSGRSGGALSLVFGIPTTIVGVILLAASDDTRTAGIITTAVGVGLIGLGAVLIATSSTDVYNEQGRAIAKNEDKSLRSRVRLTPRGLVF